MLTEPYEPTTLGFWEEYLVQMRPYLFFVSGVAGLTGLAIAYATTPAPVLSLVAAFIPLFMAYGFGQALTDCFQKDRNRLSAPSKPLSKGLLYTKDVAVVSVVGLLTCGLILVSLRFSNIYLAILSVLGLASYTYVKRHYWWGGLFYNAFLVLLLPVMACLSLGGSWRMLPLPVFLLIFFSYSSFVLSGYLKNLAADRATGYRTFSVQFGWNKTVLAGNILVLLSASCCLWMVWGSIPGMLLWLAGTTLAVRGQFTAYQVQARNLANFTGPVLAALRSFILWQLAVVLTYQPDWWGQVIPFYLLFELALNFRPDKQQI
ncbi:UbiA family prenyltransferase [Pontibacter sp. HJ8]